MSGCPQVSSGPGVSVPEEPERVCLVSATPMHRGLNCPACLWNYPVGEVVWSLAASLLESYVPWLLMQRQDVFVLWLCPQPVPFRKWKQACVYRKTG